MKSIITFNPAITIEEARELVNAHGMRYPNTDHNRKMIAQALREVLDSLRK